MIPHLYLSLVALLGCFGRPNLADDPQPRTMRGKLTVTVKHARGLKGDAFSKPEPYVTVTYNQYFSRTNWIKSESNPTWNTAFNLGHVPANHELILKVWDKDVSYDDYLGSCSTYLHQGSYTKSCSLHTGGSLTYYYQLTCDPPGSGYLCQ